MEWLQRIYIFFLNPFCGLSEKIDPKIKRIGIYITCFLLYSTCYVWYSIIGLGTPLTLLSRMLQSIVLIIVLIFFGLEKPLQPVRWNKLVIYLWFVLGALIFILGFFNEQNTGYWMTGPVIAIGLPCFYMVYGKREKYEVVFDAVCKAAMICTLFYFIFCLYGERISDNVWDAYNRYNGISDDANKIGELCLTSFSCCMYYILIGKEKLWRALSVVSLGIIIGQVHLTQSRTTILAMICIAVFFAIIIIKDTLKNKEIKLILNSIICIVIVATVAFGTVGVIKSVHENYIGIKNEDTIEYKDLVPEKGEDLNAYSSGRLFIWKTYVERFNLIGNPADAEKTISPDITVRTAHNSLIEITYRSGYITGIIYLMLEIITGLFVSAVMLRDNRKNSEGHYFIAIVSIAYIIFTNLMPSYNPLTAIVFLLYAIAFPALLDKKTED